MKYPKCGREMVENLRSIGGMGRTTYLLTGYYCKCSYEERFKDGEK